MALRFIDSFDHYQSPEAIRKWTSSYPAVDSAAIEIGTGRCGSNCVQLGTNGRLLRGITLAAGATPAKGTAGFAFKGKLTWPSPFCAVTNVDTVAQWYLSVAPDGTITVSDGDNGVQASSAPDMVRADSWTSIEVSWTIHPTAGSLTVRVNNLPVITATGISTQYSGYANNNWTAFEFRCGSNTENRFDDLYVLDDAGPAPLNTFLGDCRVEYLRPRAAGPLQQWTPVGAGSHWSAVDDTATPDEDASYVEAATPGLTDTNLYQPTGLPSGPIFGAQLSLYARKTEIGPRVIQPVVNGTPSGPTASPGADTYQYYSTLYPTNPATGLAWTIAEINAAAFGVTVVS